MWLACTGLAIPGAAQASDCAELTRLDLPNITITAAAPVPAGSFTEPQRASREPQLPRQESNLMIHHVSFGVTDPKRVAHALAEVTGAAAVRAPSPPFPQGAWFVVAGDDRGSLLEILPASAAFAADAPFGLCERPAVFEPVGTHVLVSAVLSQDRIETIARREGWHTQEIEIGLFKIVKLWIDGAVLVEVFPEGEARRYVETFGTAGLPSLDSRLRDLEAKMTRALSG